MSHTRIRVAAAMILATSVVACGDDSTSRIAGATSPDYEGRPPVFNAGCNGVNGSQLRVLSSGGSTQLAPGGIVAFGERPQRLEQVIVYGNPIERPRGGYGAPGTYGGTTQTFIYDRNALDQCSFGTDNTFSLVGPVADDTLDVPIIAPDSIPQELWNSLPPAVKKQLREAAWYLADHFIPNDMPMWGPLVRDYRRAFYFQKLAEGYDRAMDLRLDRRRETAAFAYTYNSRYRDLSREETLRADALIIGCLTATSFRTQLGWLGQEAEDYASRVTAGWASEATKDYALRYLEPQLSMLGAIGADFGREGHSCGSAARYHFEKRPNDLFDPSQGGGGGNPFLF
ncbi:MAG: hypothetical protein H7099_05950 [Gemmatimonadaceae bacterium]|nr:hypothetical protein [Gemmatimonadaceae bacterium]